MSKWQKLVSYSGRSEYNHQRYLRYKHLNVDWWKKRNRNNKLLNIEKNRLICTSCDFSCTTKKLLREHKQEYHSY